LKTIGKPVVTKPVAKKEELKRSSFGGGMTPRTPRGDPPSSGRLSVLSRGSKRLSDKEEDKVDKAEVMAREQA